MPIREITVEELAAAVAGGAAPILLDVRREDETARGTLPGAIAIPLDELSERVEELPPGPIVAYCHHGIRSRSAAAILVAAGRTDAASLRGGTEAWSLRIDPRLPRY